MVWSAGQGVGLGGWRVMDGWLTRWLTAAAWPMPNDGARGCVVREENHGEEEGGERWPGGRPVAMWRVHDTGGGGREAGQRDRRDT